MSLRRADFAGAWYPGRKSECIKAIEEFVETDLTCPSSERQKMGGIVPHAGWFFSGRIACHVIKCLKSENDPDTIIIFGKHLHPGSSNSIMKEGRWDTPLGDIKIDKDLAERLAAEFSFQIETTGRYEQDNTIELQLPFIKYFFPGSMIIPIGVPPAIPSLAIGKRAAEISLEMGRRLAVLGSTDLTHYGYNYGYTPMGTGKEAVDWVKNDNDRRAVDLMLKMDAEGVINESLKNHNVCCPGAVGTAIAAVKKLGAKKGEKLLYTTSYDVRPDSSFVGYVGIVFH